MILSPDRLWCKFLFSLAFAFYCFQNVMLLSINYEKNREISAILADILTLKEVSYIPTHPILHACKMYCFFIPAILHLHLRSVISTCCGRSQERNSKQHQPPLHIPRLRTNSGTIWTTIFVILMRA